MSTTTSTQRLSGVAREEHLRRLRRIAQIAKVMDSAIRIPGIGVRVGADSILGLIPGVGDVAGGAVGLFIINEARKLGLPSHKLLKMLGNVGLDAVVGSIPLLGDVFDVYFKSHRRNAQMILDHFGEDRLDVDLETIKDLTPRN